MLRWVFVALLAGTLAMPVLADPHPQLVNSVQARLGHYNLSADVSLFATPTVARLHFALSERNSYIRKRSKLKSILRTAKYK